MLHLFFVPWRKQLSLNVGHLFDLLLIKDYVKTLRSLYFTNLNKIHSSFPYRPVTMCLLRETTRQPPDDHPTATRRPPLLLSVSCIERIYTVRIFKQKRRWEIRPEMYLWVRKAWRLSSHREQKGPEIFGTITRAQHRHHPGENHYHQCQGWDENGAKSLET